MGRSQETYNKKEREKKKRKKKKDKAERREQRKLDAVEGLNKQPQFMYLDEDGNLSETPPDPTKKKKEVSLEDIEISIPKQDKSIEIDHTRLGKVKFFNTEKGYGFINDLSTQESVFVHMEGLLEEIRENDKVTFEVRKGPKGLIAEKVKIYVKPPPPKPKPPVTETPAAEGTPEDKVEDKVEDKTEDKPAE